MVILELKQVLCLYICNNFTRFLYPFKWYFRGFKLTGPFVIMIYRMLANDLIKFGSMYFIFVMGFAQCKFYWFLHLFLMFFSLDLPVTTNQILNTKCQTMFLVVCYCLNSLFKRQQKLYAKGKVCPIENNTNLNSIFCLKKSSEIDFIFLTCILPD